jgi:hypothetical protein
MELELTFTITKLALALLTAALAELYSLFIARATATATVEALFIIAAMYIEAIAATGWMAVEALIEAWERSCFAVAFACWSEWEIATFAELTAAMMLLEQSLVF